MNPEEIANNNEIILDFIQRYTIDDNPIEISFRKLFPEIKTGERYTHLIHAYPAKLLVHIPYLFLNNTILSKEGDFVLDPFVGSGTVMLEGLLANRNVYGADANPLARLISEVKVSTPDLTKLKSTAKSIVAKAKMYKKYNIPSVVNYEYWFPQTTILSLSKILTAINKTEDDDIRKFMLISFSNCIKKVSYADQRISVPVKLNPNRYPINSKEWDRISSRISQLETIDVFEKFNQIVNENIVRLKSVNNSIDSKYKARIISDDARNLTCSLHGKKRLAKESIQLVITSPPYAGAQKYIRASSLNIGWTELAKANELLCLERKNIGREHFKKKDLQICKTGIKDADILIEQVNSINPTRAKIICTYILEMIDALNEMVRVLKTGGFLILIVGNNKVCELEFNTQEYFTNYLTSIGLKLKFKLIDDIRSYGLMTKRNKTADIISREWILAFQKTSTI